MALFLRACHILINKATLLVFKNQLWSWTWFSSRSFGNSVGVAHGGTLLTHIDTFARSQTAKLYNLCNYILCNITVSINLKNREFFWCSNDLIIVELIHLRGGHFFRIRSITYRNTLYPQMTALFPKSQMNIYLYFQFSIYFLAI